MPRFSGPLLVLLLGFALPAAADRMVLVETRTARAWLDFEVKPSRLENSAPDVIKVIPGSRWGEVVFYARKPGKALVTVLDPRGDGDVAFDVLVLDRRVSGQTRVIAGIPDSVRVTVDGPYVVLEGVVANAGEMNQVQALAREASTVLVAVQERSTGRSELPRPERSKFVEDQPVAPDLRPVDSDSFERYAVTLLPGMFVLASHAFRTGGSAQSDVETVEATTDERRTLFVGKTPGRAIYVVRDERDRRWIVFDVIVLDPARTAVLRSAPALPPGVRVSLREGRVVLEGTVSSPDDAGDVEVVTALFPETVNRVEVREPLPAPEP